MAESYAIPEPLAFGSAGRVGVIDIGSNSVRLVVYDAAIRLPVVLFNEKALCGLGRRLASTGRLDSDGVSQALDTLRRFAVLLRAMEVDEIEIVATAAVRDAENGRNFVEQARRAIGQPIRILSGQEEARLSALGVAAGIPEARGIVGDLGGGSLELIEISGADQDRRTTVPLGPLMLVDRSGGDLSRAKALIDEAVTAIDWLPEQRGRTLYAVGGVWRALSRIEMALTDYPLHILHQYAMDKAAVRALCQRISRMSRKSLERLPGISRKRLDTIPYGALVLDRVVRAMRAERVVVSAFGLREGVLYDHMPESLRAEHPLLAACRLMAARLGRFPDHADELLHWSAPIFPDETSARRRMREAACHISDIGWRIHPDYRAEHSMEEILRSPLVGLDHAERAMLALTVYVRYQAPPRPEIVGWLDRLMDPERTNWAHVMGYTLRLAHTLSGAAPGVLDGCALALEGQELVLRLTGRCRDLASDEVLRRLDALGRALGRRTRLASG